MIKIISDEIIEIFASKHRVTQDDDNETTLAIKIDASQVAEVQKILNIPRRQLLIVRIQQVVEKEEPEQTLYDEVGEIQSDQADVDPLAITVAEAN